MIHPKYKYCFDKIFQLVKIKIIMTICLKSTRTHFQNMKLIEWSLSEIQVKHWCIIEWEYITAKHDFAVAQPNIIHFTWNFVRSIIKYITMFLFIHLKNNTFMCDVIRVYHWVVVYHWTVDGCIAAYVISLQNVMIQLHSYMPQTMPRKQETPSWEWPKLAINSWVVTWNMNWTFYRLAI